MLSFVNDYSEGAHPKLLERLTEILGIYHAVGRCGDVLIVNAHHVKQRAALGIGGERVEVHAVGLLAEDSGGFYGNAGRRNRGQGQNRLPAFRGRFV